jgi:hypothetical protein
MANGIPLWTRDDLALMPEDGNRYEVLDGELFVTLGPAPTHQGIAFELAKVLDAYCRANRIGAIAVPLGRRSTPALRSCLDAGISWKASRDGHASLAAEA